MSNKPYLVLSVIVTTMLLLAACAPAGIAAGATNAAVQSTTAATATAVGSTTAATQPNRASINVGLVTIPAVCMIMHSTS